MYRSICIHIYIYIYIYITVAGFALCEGRAPQDPGSGANRFLVPRGPSRAVFISFVNPRNT